MFGVEIQATAAANLITRQWVRRASPLTEGFVALVVTFIMCTAIFLLRPQWGGLLLLGFSLLWAVTSYSVFLQGFFIPGFTLICILLPMAFLVSTMVYYMVTLRSQQQVEKAFQMYLSPEMARQMRTNAHSLDLGGDNVYATALFTDIEGFTSITENMTATETSKMLNAYFTEVMDVIFTNKGTLIKFIGDAVFALWGAPIKETAHAAKACETAVRIQQEVVKFNASGRFPPLNTRVGINTGSMVVGNLGSAKRFDYTAIGDTINLAARLEGLNKYFHTRILISESTKREIGDKIKTVKLGAFTVAGKRQSVEVYTIFDPHLEAPVEDNWNRALRRFAAKNWDEAEKLLNDIIEIDPRLTATADLYFKEIKKYREHEPREDWKGEVEFTSK
jgi:adenylate cyclase